MMQYGLNEFYTAMKDAVANADQVMYEIKRKRKSE